MTLAGCVLSIVVALLVLVFGPETGAPCQDVGFPNDAYRSVADATVGYNHIDIGAPRPGLYSCSVPSDATWWVSLAVLLLGLALTALQFLRKRESNDAGLAMP